MTRVTLLLLLASYWWLASFAVRLKTETATDYISDFALYSNRLDNLKSNNCVLGSLRLYDCKIIHGILSLVSNSSWKMNYQR
jgi:hypothetical protein